MFDTDVLPTLENGRKAVRSWGDISNAAMFHGKQLDPHTRFTLYTLIAAGNDMALLLRNAERVCVKTNGATCAEHGCQGELGPRVVES